MIDDVRQVAEAARLGGGEKSRVRHESRGKMLPRRRVAGLLDSDAFEALPKSCLVDSDAQDSRPISLGIYMFEALSPDVPLSFTVVAL